ncbi:MAG: complex I subunit 5 family protein [Planctomycetota bacterium]|jgi:multicomponent Na+:H+ antiporter subunit D
MEVLLPLLVALPLGFAFGIVILAHVPAARRATAVLATAVVLANLVIAGVLFSGGGLNLYVGGWGDGKTLGIELVCDGFAQLMLLVINAVAFAAILFAGPYMQRFTKLWLFQSLFLLMTGAMNAVVLAGDLFNLFVFIEVAAIASYALVAFGTESEELEAAFKYLILGTVGSAFILLGVTILYSLTGHLNMKMVAKLLAGAPGGPAVFLAAAALISGLALKAAMVPFHAWLPDAHPSAPAPISAMLSGVLIKASGVYAIARIVFNVLGPTTQYGSLLIVLGVASMVVGMFLALGQWDFKRLLAYSSISQAGYIVLALGAAAYLARAPGKGWLAELFLFGGLFHLLNHAAFKSLLFLSSGSIEQQAGTRQLKQMGGLARTMPVTSFCCRVGALSISGVPPFNGFFSKLIIIISLALARMYALCAIAVGVAVGTLLMYIKVQRYALEGAPAGRAARAKEAPALMCVAVVLLAIVCIVAGVALVPLREYLFKPAWQALLGAAR